MNSVHYIVSGLASSESKTKLKNSLDKIEGVQAVAVDLGRGTVEVEFNNPATSVDIRQCIENTGYQVN